MGKFSKEKGASFERLVCDKLSRWIEPGTARSFFWRSSMSGGRATLRRAAGKVSEDQSGDICSTAAEGHAFLQRFTVECKHVKNLSLGSGAMGTGGELCTFWRQVARDAAKSGKRPLLVARQNAGPILAFIRTADYSQYFGAISALERARLFRLSTRLGAPSVSMFFLDDLLSQPYAEARYVQQSLPAD